MRRWVTRLFVLEGALLKEPYFSIWVPGKKRGQQVLAYTVLPCLKSWRPCPALAEGDAGMRPLPSPSFSLSLQDLYLLIMKDESLYQDLREDTLRLHQLVETVELK